MSHENNAEQNPANASGHTNAAAEPSQKVEALIEQLSLEKEQDEKVFESHDLLFDELNADKLVVRGVADLQGHLLGATLEEIAAAGETVARALAHPLMRRASVASIAGRCRRETPIAVQLEDGILVEGKVDLAFRDESDPGSWTVAVTVRYLLWDVRAW
jgi:hypothetical protein